MPKHSCCQQKKCLFWALLFVHSEIKVFALNKSTGCSSFSTYELVVDVVECRWCRWYVWMFHLRFKKWLSVLCHHNMFLSLFTMNQIYDCFRCTKALAILLGEMRGDNSFTFYTNLLEQLPRNNLDNPFG